MITWGHMIWIFFPIPLFCLLLLATPFPLKIERIGTNLVGSIFFTRVSVGRLYIRLVWVFIAASFLMFGVATRVIQMGFASAHVPCSGWVVNICSLPLSRSTPSCPLLSLNEIVANMVCCHCVITSRFASRQSPRFPNLSSLVVRHAPSIVEKQCGTAEHRGIALSVIFGWAFLHWCCGFLFTKYTFWRRRSWS